ncbi:MAG: dethiobiotin synthase [Polyangiales bacterium]|nr:dethiobiotin synthase [Myxococcales bacterium]
MKGAFVTATGTGVGKTFVTRALVTALRNRGERAIAIKPVETGIDSARDTDSARSAESANMPETSDAAILAAASGDASLANALGFHRGTLPLAPYAASLEGEGLPPSVGDLVAAVHAAAKRANATRCLVEGAGGLAVPLDAAFTFADFAEKLAFPLVVVATDALGTLSHTLTLAAAANLHALRIDAVVLNLPPGTHADDSTRTNGRILAERLAVPVVRTADADWEDAVLRALAL